MSQLDKVRQWVSTQEIQVAYISDPKSIEYLTGFASDPVERILGLFVFADQDPFLFAPALEVEAIHDTGWNYPVYGYLDHEKPFAMIAAQIKKRVSNPTKWAIEKSHLTIDHYNAMKSQFPSAQFDQDLTPTIQKLRLIKTPDEIEKLDAAGREADLAFQVGFEAVQAGRTEAEIAAELEYVLKKKGVMQMSFDTLIQAGAHAAEPHGATGMNKIENNELVLFDLGTIHQGYISDSSRTVAVGKPSDKALDIYKVCLDAQLTAQAKAKPGMIAEDLDKIARDIITKAGYGEYFIHRLGHGMGMGEHEFPSIMAGNKMTLEEGMCFSIEPGIYIPGVAGVRIEDCVHITKTGCEPFTHTSKKLTYVG
ncbi:M24 family metallopeptidase [Pediococcus cellicola]|uniref:X-Pro dipeptidase n=1 Tax=Pediococcus cellicola TaxID=319652 RepID=A0A0R2IJ96_9LACO|nr:Xaa-Pro peptidase family protein [Pediococcus cellicola]KRN64904.1 X-Pro dipeptidase [Pediococcus cellicola]GEL16040.1 Xaa-Pro dipeptidase [Pediococcus cellicola]